MTALFSVLASSTTATTNVSGGSGAETTTALSSRATSTTSSLGKTPISLAVPTVVQLYTPQSPLFPLEPSFVPPAYAVLSYQAVQVSGKDPDPNNSLTASATALSNADAGGLFALRNNRQLTPSVPDLGVWNVCVVAQQQQQQASIAAAGEEKKEVQPPRQLSDSLLQIPLTSQAAAVVDTFCFAVDLTSTTALHQVEPNITVLQEALIRYLISLPPGALAGGSEEDANHHTTTRSTSVHLLKTVQFGLAPEDKESAEKFQSVKFEDGDENSSIHDDDKKKCVALMICVKLPTAAATEDYRQKQTQALLVYHLRRYAAALQACLTFVDCANDDVSGQSWKNRSNNSPTKKETETTTPSAAGGSESTASVSNSFAVDSEQPALTLNQLAFVWREFALGKQVWKDTTSPELGMGTTVTAAIDKENDASALQGDEKEEEKDHDAEAESRNKLAIDTTSSAATAGGGRQLLYGPGTHNEELIETVLLRNAQYPGHWDASKQSLWKILPPNPQQSQSQQQQAKKNSKFAHVAVGDEDWLLELRESVVEVAAAAAAGGMKTPPPKKSASGTAGAGTTTDNASAAGNNSISSITNTTAKTPNEASVSNFFESFLKD